MIFIIVLILCSMDAETTKARQSYSLTQKRINEKTYFFPNHHLFGCEKYMLPKLDNAAIHHTFFSQQALEQFYKEKKIDPKELNHNLNQKKQDQEERKKLKMDQSLAEEDSSILSLQKSESLIPKKIRPPMKEKGFTHFIHIPFVQVLRDVYENQIVPRVQEEDRDLLMPLQSMHMTVMVFRLRCQEDLPMWEQVLKSAKSAKRNKINIKGAEIFSIKGNLGKVLYLTVKNAEDIIDRVVSKAIELGLVKEKDLSNIKFDKISGTYQASPHISVLRTKDDDIFDFTHYLKVFKSINVARINLSEIRMSMIGTHDGKDYFNEHIISL